jgi:endonuclease YncB( thermonuclease family)
VSVRRAGRPVGVRAILAHGGGRRPRRGGPLALALGVLLAAGYSFLGPPDPVDRVLHSRESKPGASPAGEAGELLRGRVVKVSDGDTVTVLRGREQVKVRLLGIDAPEKSQPFGDACRRKLAEAVAGKEVALPAGKRDRYGRVLGTLVLDGRDLNLRQIEEGCAWHYKQFARDQEPEDRERYAAAEVEARRTKRGLWQDGKRQAPWDYRRENRRR